MATPGTRNARHRTIGGSLLAVAAISLGLCSTALAEVAHVVAPGETLWSIAAANNLTTRTIAVYNGISEDAQLIAGQTIEVPTVAEGAGALASAGYSTSSSPTSAPSTSGVSPASGLAPIWSPSGTLYLTAAAASAWNAMRAESLRLYGVDLYPGGPYSAYRSYAQQAYLYDLYLSGQGAPADPPGTSSHELGTAVDVATPEMRWVIDQIGYRYGWTKIHGPNEWWHVDYVG
jgi:murein DD-endopeptidase MepM/ murein hydrolase activator NlpD